MKPSLLSLLLLPFSLTAETFEPFTEENVPQSVEELWGDADLRSEPLDIEVVEEWKEEGIVRRLVRYTVCTVKGKPCRVAAFYTFPEGSENGPAFVWAHGGGQRAEVERGNFFAKRGYAVLDINWGGREMVEGIETNTDWGAVDPSQGPQFYPGALRPNVKLDLEPDEHTIDPVPSGRNGNWFLLTYAARRGFTFLEQQPEVDPEKLGITGYSMGGNITVFSAIDPRVKAAIPMVGGTGFLSEDFPGLPGSGRKMKNPELFLATNDNSAYWPHIECPVMFLNATNDFHGILDRSYRCFDLLPHDEWRASYNLHYNHGLGAEQWVLLERWFDHHLKGEGEGVPPTPPSEFSVEGGEAVFSVRPEGEGLEGVEILYSHDPRPQTRFWKTAESVGEEGSWSARLPVRENVPLFVFANCTYALGNEVEAFQGTTDALTITSDLSVHSPETLDLSKLAQDATEDAVFHDFVADEIAGWGSNAVQGSMRTYRPQDPARAIPSPTAKLVCEFGEIVEPILFRIMVSKNDFLHNGKRSETYIFSTNLKPGTSELPIPCEEFLKQGEATPMDSWDEIVHLSFSFIGQEEGKHVDQTRENAGATLKVLRWEH